MCKEFYTIHTNTSGIGKNTAFFCLAEWLDDCSGHFRLMGLSIIINIFSYEQNSRKGGRGVKKPIKMMVFGHNFHRRNKVDHAYRNSVLDICQNYRMTSK